MRRFFLTLCLILLTAQSCQAKENEAAAPPSSNPAVLVSWEDGRPRAKREAQGGTLIAWEPNRSTGTVVAPPIPAIIPLPSSRGARQFDIEEVPLSNQGMMMQAPSRILPAGAVFTPYTESAEVSHEAPAAPSISSESARS